MAISTGGQKQAQFYLFLLSRHTQYYCTYISNHNYVSESAPRYVTIGCFQDRSSRAIPTLEGQDSILDGSYKARKDAIEKCYQAAKKRGFLVFAVQDGGWCAASSSAPKTFDKYGKSSACQSDGKGGPWANQVYYIKGKRAVTCPTASDNNNKKNILCPSNCTP